MYISGQCRDKPPDRPTDGQSGRQACITHLSSTSSENTNVSPSGHSLMVLVIELTYFDLILHVYIRVVRILWYKINCSFPYVLSLSFVCLFVCLTSGSRIFRSCGDVFVSRRVDITMKLVTGSLFTGIYLRQTHVLELIQG